MAEKRIIYKPSPIGAEQTDLLDAMDVVSDFLRKRGYSVWAFEENGVVDLSVKSTRGTQMTLTLSVDLK